MTGPFLNDRWKRFKSDSCWVVWIGQKAKPRIFAPPTLETGDPGPVESGWVRSHKKRQTGKGREDKQRFWLSEKKRREKVETKQYKYKWLLGDDRFTDAVLDFLANISMGCQHRKLSFASLVPLFLLCSF